MNNIVHQVIKTTSSNYQLDDFIKITKDSTGNIKQIEYSNNLNNIKKEIVDKVDVAISNLELHNYNQKKYKHIRDGFMCEVNLNALSNVTLFSSIGPTIPLKITFNDYFSVEIDTNIKDYGINSVLIEVIATIKVDSLVTMPITSDTNSYQIKEILFMDIINGTIPNYYGINR